MIDKDSIKKDITIDQIKYILELYGGEPSLMKEGVLVSRTIDHNPAHEGSRKLYYYDNEEGGLFKSYTGDVFTFDIFELIIKIYEIQFNQTLSLPQAIKLICSLIGVEEKNVFEEESLISDFTIIKNYDKIKEKQYQEKHLDFKIYSDIVLNNLPQPRFPILEKEGISAQVIKNANIRFNASAQSIVFPYYDKNNNLIGIRERNLIEENIEQYGKYRPSYLCGQLYNHPLGLSLYNLNHSKDGIKKMKKAIIVEGEKSALKLRTFFGEENDISVATCGSSLSPQQVKLLSDLGCEEVIIAFDRDYKQINDDIFIKQVKNLKSISKRYSPIVNMTFIWDKENLLDPHDSPVDKGKDIFLELFEKRIQL